MIAPPRPPSQEDREALIREARTRQMRRRQRMALVLVGLSALAVAAFGIARPFVRGAATSASRRGPFANVRAFKGGGRLAFVSRGSLYVLGRRLVRVSRDGASAPAFSPNGRWLSYQFRGRVGVALADGSDPHLLGRHGGARWLPDGHLLVGRTVYRMGADGIPSRAGMAPADLAGWAPDGSAYVFVRSRIVHGKQGAFHGVELLQVSASVHGPRTTWYRVPQSFTPKGGFTTAALGVASVLPQRRGILFWLDPSHSASIAADGLPLFELRSPNGHPHRLGVSVAAASVSVGPGGRLAIGAGGDRYAWTAKHIATCSTVTEHCASPPAGSGLLSLDPAWSPDGRTLAYVTATPEKASNFRQGTIKRWYTTRHLWLLSSGSPPHEVPGTAGAAAPTWSRDGSSLLFVRHDSLWLLPRLDTRPIRIAGPLFNPDVWPSYYGQIDWQSQFAWQPRP